MREYKFRGKNKKGVWIYGYYFKYNDTHNIVPDTYSSKPSDHFNVDPKTIGQLSGLKDKNDQEIYEGDKVLFLGATGVVFYREDSAMFMCKFKINRSVWSFDSMLDGGVIEVIGNIHD